VSHRQARSADAPLHSQVQAQQFAKQTSRWIAMVNDFDKSLKARLCCVLLSA
jgi:hypothetical protein